MSQRHCVYYIILTEWVNAALFDVSFWLNESMSPCSTYHFDSTLLCPLCPLRTRVRGNPIVAVWNAKANLCRDSVVALTQDWGPPNLATPPLTKQAFLHFANPFLKYPVLRRGGASLLHCTPILRRGLFFLVQRSPVAGCPPVLFHPSFCIRMLSATNAKHPLLLAIPPVTPKRSVLLSPPLWQEPIRQPTSHSASQAACQLFFQLGILPLVAWVKARFLFYDTTTHASTK